MINDLNDFVFMNFDGFEFETLENEKLLYFVLHVRKLYLVGFDIAQLF